MSKLVTSLLLAEETIIHDSSWLAVRELQILPRLMANTRFKGLWAARPLLLPKGFTHVQSVPLYEIAQGMSPVYSTHKDTFSRDEKHKKKNGLNFTLVLLWDSFKKLILINIQDVDMFCYQNHNSLSRLHTIVENVTQVSMQHVMVIHSYMCPS